MRGMKLAAGIAVMVLGTSHAIASPVDDLRLDAWTRIDRASLLSVAPDDGAGRAVRCVDGPSSVVSAWSGAAYDSRRHRLLVFGGGHRNYCGNEVYAFDVHALAWTRLTEPSPPPFDRDPLGDGAPASRHTYDGLQYSPRADRMIAFGGSRSTDGHETRLTWLFDPEARTWRNAEPAGSPPGAGQAYNLSSAYDAATDRMLMRDPRAIYALDLAANTWTKLADAPHTWSQQRGAIDPTRRLYFTIGAGEFTVFDIDKQRDVTSEWSTQGADGLIGAPAPGLDYDPDTDALVGWSGGAPYILALNGRRWTRSAAPGAPAAQQPFGTFGRWRYVPDLHAFILVNAADAVYFYRPPPKSRQ